MVTCMSMCSCMYMFSCVGIGFCISTNVYVFMYVYVDTLGLVWHLENIGEGHQRNTLEGASVCVCVKMSGEK